MTNKQAVIIILMMACFLSINTFIILQHTKFYSYLSEDVVSIIDMSFSFMTEYDFINHIINHRITDAVSLLYNYWKPPAFFVLSAPFLLLIKNINLFLSVFNFLLIFLTLFSIYGIVKKIHSTPAGIFASFILCCCPLFFSIHRTFFIETLLTTSISVILYIIVKNKFDNIYRNIFLIIILTIGLLTKEQIFIFFVPFLLFILKNKENYTNIKRILNIFAIFVTSYLLSYVIWYGNNAQNIFSHLLKYATITANNDYFYYIKSFYNFDLGPFIFILFIISLIYFLIKRKHSHIIFSFIFILFLFSLSSNKVSRHIYPLIIFCPILISLFIFQIKNIYLKRTLLAILSVLLFIQYLTVNYSVSTIIFYNYNFFKGISNFNYKPSIESYLQQYYYLQNILGNNFEERTAFIHFYPPMVYNFLILQSNRKAKTCNIYTSCDIKFIKENINLYDNIIISKSDIEIFNSFTDWLLQNGYSYNMNINIFNHTQAQTCLYRKNSF